MIEQNIYTVLIVVISYLFSDMLHGKTNKYLIFLYILLFFAVIRYLLIYLSAYITTEEEFVHAQRLTIGIFLLFIAWFMIYFVILKFFQAFYKPPKKEKWKFENIIDKKSASVLNESNNFEKSKDIEFSFFNRFHISFQNLKYGNFILFIQKDLPVVIIAILQLSIIWQPDFLAKKAEDMIQQEETVCRFYEQE